MVLPNRWLACPDSIAYRDQPGDWVWASVFAKYLDPSTRGASGSYFAQLIRDLENNASHVVTDGATAGTNPSIPFAGLMGHGAADTGAPKAYLNILVFNEKDELVNFAYKQLSTSAAEDGSDVPHEAIDVYTPIYEPGYVYIYLSNEAGSRVEVFFDDYRVTQAHGLFVQKEDFYPFGMCFNSYRRPGETDQNYLINGKERDEVTGWDDFGARMYMPDLGRWGVVDPLADHPKQIGTSPYAFVNNNPIRYVDPTGMIWENVPGGQSTNDPEDIADFLSQYQNRGSKQDKVSGQEDSNRDNSPEKTYDGGALPEHTVTAPRYFGGVLGRAADKWRENNLGYSTFGRRGSEGLGYETQWSQDFRVFTGAGYGVINSMLFAGYGTLGYADDVYGAYAVGKGSRPFVQLNLKIARSPAGQRIFSFQARFPKFNLNIRLDRGFRAPLSGMSKSRYFGKQYNGFNTHINIQRPGSFNYHLPLNPLKWKYYNIP